MRFRIAAVSVVAVLAGAAAWGYTAEDLVKDLNGANSTPDKQLAAAMRLKDFVQFPEVVTALSAKLDDAGGDAVLRANCAMSLGYSKDPSVFPMVRALAKKPEEKPIVRAGCVVAMALIRGEEVIGEFIEMLKTEKSGIVRSQIEDSLMKMQDAQKVVVAVGPLLKEPDAEASAIRVLGAVGGPAVIAPLAKQLDQGRASSRRAVIRALGSIRAPDSAKALVAFYPKANDAEKVEILGVLSIHPHPSAIALMIAELGNLKTYPAVRRRAAMSLGALKATDGIRPLVKVLLNTAEADGLRITCAQALGDFSDRDDQAIAGLIGSLPDKKVAEESALALNRILDKLT